MGGISAGAAQYVLACVFFVCCEAVTGVPYTISQTNKLSIHRDGRVDVLMTMTFHSKLGTTFSKSILPNASSPSLDMGSLVATDSLGQNLPVHHIIQQGWHHVVIDFIHPVNGPLLPQYRVHLRYSVLGSICSTLGSRQRINLDWAHRWGTAKLIQSRYELEFVGARPLMDSLCFASSSVRPKCGRYTLDVNGSVAAYQVGAGVLHGAFFTWTAAAGSISQRKCGGPQYVNIRGGGAAANMQDSEKQGISTVLIVVCIGSCICLSLASLFCILICKVKCSRRHHPAMDAASSRTSPKQLTECSPVTLLTKEVSCKKSERTSDFLNDSGDHVSTSASSPSPTIDYEKDLEEGFEVPEMVEEEGFAIPDMGCVQPSHAPEHMFNNGCVQPSHAPDHMFNNHANLAVQSASIVEHVGTISKSIPSQPGPRYAGAGTLEFERSDPSPPRVRSTVLL